MSTTTSTSQTDVLVVGAGPTGLTLAAVLASHGVRARVVDAGHGLTTQSRALVVHARTVELWDKLGIGQRAVASGQRLVRVYARLNGRLLGGGRPLLNLGTASGGLTPHPFLLVFEQSKSERLLHDRLCELRGTPEAVDWHTRLTDLRPESGESGPVTATLERADGTTERLRARWVVGCDGASSTVRQNLGLAFEGGTYEEEFFLADVDLDDAPDLDRDGGLIDFTDEGGLVFLPMRGAGDSDRQVRVLGVAPAELSGRHDLSRSQVQQALDRYSTLGATVTATRWTSTYRLHHRMVDRFRVGRVFLAGDAAHIHSPLGGLGMNTGIQDAYNLGWKLGLVCRGQAREALLDSYEPERLPVARGLLKGTDQGFKVAPLRNGRLNRLVRSTLLPLAPRLISLSRADASLFRTVSQTGISYRGSPAVAPAGRRGPGPRPGDRAPHAVLAAGEHRGESVLALMRGPGHHLLVLAQDEAAGREASRAATELTDRYAPQTRVHLLGPDERAVHAAYGVTAATAVLVRPDGYLAWRGPADSLAALAPQLDRWYPRAA